MSDPQNPGAPELVVVPGAEPTGAPAGEATAQPADSQSDGSVVEPAKVMRIGAMVKQLLDEVRRAPLDDAGRQRLRDVHEMAVTELAEGLSPDLREELGKFTLPFDEEAPTESELRVAQAQLVGWLEGLFHGIQATLFAQQMAARAQLEELQRRGLPPGARSGGPDGDRPGTYL